jgi:hypothetical protein
MVMDDAMTAMIPQQLEDLDLADDIFLLSHTINMMHIKLKFTRPESASELYRQSDRHLSDIFVNTFEDRGCDGVGETDPSRYPRIRP